MARSSLTIQIFRNLNTFCVLQIWCLSFSWQRKPHENDHYCLNLEFTLAKLSPQLLLSFSPLRWAWLRWTVKEVLPDVVFYMIDFDLRVKCPSCKDLCLSVGKSYWVIFVRLLTKTSRKCEPMPVCFTDSSLLPDSVLFKQSIFPQESLLVNSTSHGYCLMSLLFYRNIRNQRTSIPFKNDISLK